MFLRLVTALSERLVQYNFDVHGLSEIFDLLLVYVAKASAV